MPESRAIKGLGEIALQVDDLAKMTSFYVEVVNLEILKQFPASTFFRIADGYQGHTQILALFDRSGDDTYPSAQSGRRRPPLDHLAFSVSLDDFDRERDRIVDLGYKVSETCHSWVGWKSLYVEDPEGNQVEWVCFDESILEPLT